MQINWLFPLTYPNNLVIIDELDNYSMTDVVGVLNEN